MWHCEMEASSLSGFGRQMRFCARKRLKNEKESPRRGAWRAQTLYITRNMHMIKKQLRPQPGAPFGHA
jgi:hypothetical protein